MNTTSITPSMKLQRTDNVVATNMDGETVMMDIDSGSYFALTGSGSQIWAALEKPITVGEITQRVHQDFEVGGFDNLDEAVSTFVEDLFKNGLVIAVD